MNVGQLNDSQNHELKKFLTTPTSKPRAGFEYDILILDLIDDIEHLKKTLELIAEAPMSANDARDWAKVALEEAPIYEGEIEE